VRESGEKFWYNRVVVKTSSQNEEKGPPFKGGKEERPLFDELQVSPIDHLFQLGVNVMYHEDMYLVVQQV
jgi:hypothetical protein